MRAVVSRSLFVAATLAFAGAGVGASSLFACASDDAAPDQPATDGGSESSLLGEGGLAEAEAGVPVGDICGDPAGLEKDAPWPLRGGCPKRAGVAATPGPQTSGVKWATALPAGESSPAISADRLIWVGTTDGDVAVLSADGILQSTFRTGAPVFSSPARSASGLTVIGSKDGMLYGVVRGAALGDAGADASTDAGDLDDASDEGGAPVPGRAVFTHAVGPIASSPAIGGDGTIYVSATDGKLYAVAADGSATKWSVATNDTTGSSSPALAADGTIYIGSSDKKLYAFTPAGLPKWTFDTGGAIIGSPAVGGDETVYVGSSDGKLYAVGPDGKMRWTYTTGGSIGGAPAVLGGTVYVGSDDKSLHAVNTVTGAKTWTYATLGAVGTPVIGADAVIYVGSADTNVYAISPSGRLFFAVNVKGSVHSAPAIGDDGTLYVTTDKNIVAVGQ